MENIENVESTEAETDEYESDGEFSFETDYLVLRSNKDYSDLLKYIVRLESQKIKALNDIENLADAQNRALQDPLQFVENLKAGKANFPPRQTIAEIPNINWSEYGIDSSLLDNDSLLDTKPNKDDLDSSKIRGRTFTVNKPETFNQLWSCEEQKKLEELLEVYPEEPVEARRYKKIARDLGTRTPIQVMCRIQKYFAKLAKAGMPIPGRAPKGVIKQNKSVFYKKSTFFPQLHVPVTMEELNSEALETCASTETYSSSKYKLGLLKAAREHRLLDEISPVYQTKSICVGCQKTGFLGARWTDNAGTDYCTDCVVKLLPSNKLMPVRNLF